MIRKTVHTVSLTHCKQTAVCVRAQAAPARQGGSSREACKCQERMERFGLAQKGRCIMSLTPGVIVNSHVPRPAQNGVGVPAQTYRRLQWTQSCCKNYFLPITFIGIFRKLVPLSSGFGKAPLRKFTCRDCSSSRGAPKVASRSVRQCTNSSRVVSALTCLFVAFCSPILLIGSHTKISNVRQFGECEGADTAAQM